MRARLRFRPTSLLVVLVVLAAAESLARWGVAEGVLEPNRTLDALVAANTAYIESHRPDVWLIGNSTLHAAADTEQVTAARGKDVAVLTHAAATVRGSAAMLEYYARTVGYAPRAVGVFISKDDLNPNGTRARNSQHYQSYDGPNAPVLDVLMLSSCRDSIGRLFHYAAVRLLFLLGGRLQSGAEALRPWDEAEFDGRAIPPLDGSLRLLAENFDVDTESFGVFADTCRRLGIEKIAVVLLPVTDRYIEFHESHHPAWPYTRIRETARAAAISRGAAWIDLGDASHEYQRFRDSYHLRGSQRAELSALLGHWLRAWDEGGFGEPPRLALPW